MRGDLEAWPWLLCSSASVSGLSGPCPDEVWLLKGIEVRCTVWFCMKW